VFDLPPILGISDVSALSSNVDGILFVLGANEVDREAVQKAKESLEKVKAPILGLVLNKVKFEPLELDYKIEARLILPKLQMYKIEFL